ncbi:MAG: flagellar basal body rod C-terminal domain-containing protein [Pseudomonas sp.]
MATLDLMSSGLNSVRQGQYRVSNAAADIARVGVAPDPAAAQAVPQGANGQPVAAAAVETNRPVNLVNSMVELQLGQREVEVGASVIDTADEVLGTLLDVTA